TRSCLVCTESTSIGHAGVDACRACASFYKRTVLFGKNLPCRQGNGQCVFRKHQRFSCRSCRFKKCADLGMTLSVTTPIPAQNSESIDLPPISESRTAGVFENTHDECVLKKIQCAYKQSCDRRRAQELHFAKLFNLCKSDHSSKEYFISTVRHNFESFRVLLLE
ncbi:hypothetical protein PMAYCL1PPCAC_15186, partial [Pristionchus mayeri]